MKLQSRPPAVKTVPTFSIEDIEEIGHRVARNLPSHLSAQRLTGALRTMVILNHIEDYDVFCQGDMVMATVWLKNDLKSYYFTIQGR